MNYIAKSPPPPGGIIYDDHTLSKSQKFNRDDEGAFWG